MSKNGPIIAAALWRQVVDVSQGRCACTGWCGRSHSASAGRCRNENHADKPLHAIPRAATLGEPVGDIAAMRLGADRLVGVCDDCHCQILAACRRAARAEAAEAAARAPALFDFGDTP